MKWVGGLLLCRAATLLWQDADALQRLLQESPATFQHVSSQNEAAEAVGASNDGGLNMFAPSWSRASSVTTVDSGQLAAQPNFLRPLSQDTQQQPIEMFSAAQQPPLQQPAMQPQQQALQPAAQPAVQPGMQALQQTMQWFNFPTGSQTQTPPQAMATQQSGMLTDFAQLATPVNPEPSSPVGMLSPYEYEEVKPVVVQSAPSPGDDGRFDESDRVKAFIQGLRGPSPRMDSAPRFVPAPAQPAAQPAAMPAAQPLALLGTAAAVQPVDFFSSAHDTGLSRWMDYFSSQNDSLRAREQR
jgi:hypothetical protein